MGDEILSLWGEQKPKTKINAMQGRAELRCGVWEISAAKFALSQTTMWPEHVLHKLPISKPRTGWEQISVQELPSDGSSRQPISRASSLLGWRPSPWSGFPVAYLSKRSTSKSFSIFRVLWARAMTRKPCTVYFLSSCGKFLGTVRRRGEGNVRAQGSTYPAPERLQVYSHLSTFTL